MCKELEIKLSVDKQHVWIGDRCLGFKQAEEKAAEIQAVIEYARIWGSRNDRRTKNAMP